MSAFTITGHDILAEDEALPVLVRCSTCGSSALIGEHDYAEDLLEVTDWAAAHECPRTLTVN